MTPNIVETLRYITNNKEILNYYGVQSLHENIENKVLETTEIVSYLNNISKEINGWTQSGQSPNILPAHYESKKIHALICCLQRHNLCNRASVDKNLIKDAKTYLAEPKESKNLKPIQGHLSDFKIRLDSKSPEKSQGKQEVTDKRTDTITEKPKEKLVHIEGGSTSSALIRPLDYTGILPSPPCPRGLVSSFVSAKKLASVVELSGLLGNQEYLAKLTTCDYLNAWKMLELELLSHLKSNCPESMNILISETIETASGRSVGSSRHNCEQMNALIQQISVIGDKVDAICKGISNIPLSTDQNRNIGNRIDRLENNISRGQTQLPIHQPVLPTLAIPSTSRTIPIQHALRQSSPIRGGKNLHYGDI